MAQKIWIEKWRTTDGKLDEFSEMFLERQYDDDVEFLALTLAEVAEIRKVIRSPERCGPCLGSGKVTVAAIASECSHCSGTGLGPRARKVLEMLK